VDQDKVAFLFGELPSWADPDDPDDREALISRQFSGQGHSQGPGAESDGDDGENREDGKDGKDGEGTPGSLGAVFRSAIANQIANDDPHEVWATAQRLLALGLDRQTVLGELVMAMLPQLQAAIEDEGPYDLDAYRAALASLPLADPADVTEALLQVVREFQPIVADELLARAGTKLSVPAGEEPHRSMFEHLLDGSIEDGNLNYVAGDMVVEPASLLVGAVLTHRISDAERSGAYLEADIDLVSFDEDYKLRGPGGTALAFSWRQALGLVWSGPEGWLEACPAGTVLAARYGEDGVSVEALATAPPVDPSAVATLRAAYEAAVEESGLPVSTQDLLMEMVARDRSLFAGPQAPITELVEAAGLERRAALVAHGREIWRNEEEYERDSRVMERTESLDQAESVLKVMALFEQGLWEQSEPLREAMLAMRASLVAEVVADELLGRGLGDDETALERAAAVTDFAERLLAAGREPAEAAVARWLMAMAAEHAGDPTEAEAHLHLAVEADGDWPPAVERLAWYLSDRGEAREAVRLWRHLGADRARDELENVEMFAGAPVAGLGRNDLCWCGSGRKFKTCHLGRVGLPPLAERVGWLAWKGVAYLQHQGARIAHDMALVGSARTDGDLGEEAMENAFEDPLLLDFLLTEGGWFEQFLEERGPLLPDDEALLATSWALVDRTIYEVTNVRPGVGMTVKDLRSAEETEVRERTFSKQVVAGMLICARAVPDGEGYQFVGGLFVVRVGEEAALLDVLDRGDPEELAAWVGRLDRAPALRNTESEPLVACRAVLSVPGNAVAREVLDRNYVARGDGAWGDVHQTAPGQKVVRAAILLEGPRLRVETNSEQRMERVLNALGKELPQCRILSDERNFVHLVGRGRLTGREWAPAGAVTSDCRDAARLPQEVLEQVQESFEQRWCEEQVPALGGLTPRQAAADPAGREALGRLLAHFERMSLGLPFDAITMRPARLRKMLGF
jgi:hypothetical protein